MFFDDNTFNNISKFQSLDRFYLDLSSYKLSSIFFKMFLEFKNAHLACTRKFLREMYKF